MEYDFNDETLLHSIGNNLQRLEGILNKGILSFNNAKEIDATYTKNYSISGQNDDYISCVKVGNIDYALDRCAYTLHTARGINFIIEDINYEDNNKEYFIHHPDEVLVKDRIPVSNIKGIMIPQNKVINNLDYLEIIPLDVSRFDYLKNIISNYLVFIIRHRGRVDMSYINEILKEIKEINIAYKHEENPDEKLEIYKDYIDALVELNIYLSSATKVAFIRCLDRSNITLKDVINYLTDGRIPIYDFNLGNGRQKK